MNQWQKTLCAVSVCLIPMSTVAAYEGEREQYQQQEQGLITCEGEDFRFRLEKGSDDAHYYNDEYKLVVLYPNGKRRRFILNKKEGTIVPLPQDQTWGEVFGEFIMPAFTGAMGFLLGYMIATDPSPTQGRR